MKKNRGSSPLGRSSGVEALGHRGQNGLLSGSLPGIVSLLWYIDSYKYLQETKRNDPVYSGEKCKTGKWEVDAGNRKKQSNYMCMAFWLHGDGMGEKKWTSTGKILKFV